MGSSTAVCTSFLSREEKKNIKLHKKMFCMGRTGSRPTNSMELAFRQAPQEKVLHGSDRLAPTDSMELAFPLRDLVPSFA